MSKSNPYPDQRRKPLWHGLGKRLRWARKQLNRSAHDLSEAAGLNHGIVECIEIGCHLTPTVEDVERLAATLGSPVIWLAYGPTAHLEPGDTIRLSRPVIDPTPTGIAEPYRALCRSGHVRVRQLLANRSAHDLPIDPAALAAIANAERLPLIDEAEYISCTLGATPAYAAYGIGTRLRCPDPEPAQPQDYGDQHWERPQRRSTSR